MKQKRYKFVRVDANTHATLKKIARINKTTVIQILRETFEPLRK